MRPAPAVAAALSAFVVLVGCNGTRMPATPRPTGDVPQAAKAVRSGHLALEALTARCAIFVLSGTHALLDANGEFCRARIRVRSGDSSSHDFSPFAQLLVLANGQEVAPSNGGMAVRRQPETVTLGADDLAEVVVIWDVPRGSAVTGVRLVGDGDTDAAGAFVVKAVNPAGVVVPLHDLRPDRPRTD
jgi:hypothetical protein